MATYNLTGTYSDLTELKGRIGTTTSGLYCWVFNSPGAGDLGVYLWNNTSTATPDDYDIVCPTSRIGGMGRWFRYTGLHANPNWSATTGSTAILNKPTAGTGIIMTGTTIQIDSSVVMTKAEATPIIADMVNDIADVASGVTNVTSSVGVISSTVDGIITNIDGIVSDIDSLNSNLSEKVPHAMTITINGDEQDLSVDREWNVNWASLSGKPTFNQVAFSGSWDDLTNRPEIFDGRYISLAGIPEFLEMGCDYNYLINLPTLFDGDYVSLINKPDLFSGSYTDLTNKPTLFSGAYTDLSGKPTLFDGAYVSLTGKPTLFDGNYNSLSNKPTIPAAQVSSDWTAVSGVSQILNKPTLFSGAYSDLSGKPSLFSGSYTDLTNKPTIPAAQVNSDWTASSGVSQILNKPTLFSGSYNDLTNKPTLFSGSYADLTNKPTLFSGSYTDLTNKPTIPTNNNQLSNGSGYLTGITSSQVTTALGYTPLSATTSPSFNNAPARTVGTSPTAYQISNTRNARVSYTVAITTGLSLLNLNSAAQVFLEICPTSGGTYTTINSAGVSRTLSVGVTIGLNDTIYHNIQGEVPAGYYARLRSTLSGGGTAVFSSGQEVTY